MLQEQFLLYSWWCLDYTPGMKHIYRIIIATLVLFALPLSASADSERIRKEFFNRLRNEKEFGAYELDIDVRRGVLTARGTVASELARSRVGEIAETIAGVSTVDNRVQINGRAVTAVNAPPSGSLAEKILRRVESEIGKENFSLQVAERGQEVILTGTVDTTAGGQTIARIASDMATGRTVTNQLVVREQVLTDSELVSRVLTALKQEPLIRTEDLKISASRGIVEIEGIRPNHREIDRILSVVVMVEGVRDVRSRLTIG